jgi:adenylate cyclase
MLRRATNSTAGISVARLFEELKRRNVFRVAAAYVITAWLLIQIVVSVKEPLQLPDWSDTLVIVLLAIGFPVACLLAWAYEITPEGIRAEDSTSTAGDTVAKGNRRLDYLLAGLLIVVVGIFVLDLFVRETETERPTVLVLPFENSTGDESQAYRADGLTRDLITDLGKVSGLIVMGRDTSFSFKDQPVRASEIAEQLGVDYIVNGDIGRVADTIRINAELVEAASGRNVWGERYTYERALNEISLVWDDVVREIVGSLSVQLTASDQELLARPYVPGFQAYDYYLQARELFQSKDSGRLQDSLNLYQLSIQADPEWAQAYAGYARALADIWQQVVLEIRPITVARREAEAAVAKALELDPDLADAHAVDALLAVGDGDVRAAIESATHAVELDPRSIDARTVLTIVLGYAGRWPEAVAAMEENIALEPRPSAYVATYYAWALFMNREFDRAIAVLERLDADRDPRENEYTWGANTIENLLASAYAEAGRLEDANRQVERLLAKNPWQNLRHFRLVYAQYERGQDIEFRIQALRKAGLPELPYDFDTEGMERLSHDELVELIDDKTWQGYDLGREQDHFQRFQSDGTTHYFSADGSTSMSGTAFVREDQICRRTTDLYWGGDACGEVYRNPQGSYATRDEYYYVALIVFRFSILEE